MELLKIYLWFAAGIGSVIGLVAFSVTALDAWVPWCLCWVPWLWFVLWSDRATEWKKARAARLARAEAEREAAAWLAGIVHAWRERRAGRGE